MRILLGITICILAIAVTFSLDLSVAPGLSLKNVFLYLTATALILQAILGQPPKAELGALQACFAVLVAYALLSTFAVGNLAGYRAYGIAGSLIYLKAVLVDWWVLFAVFFYGARSVDDTEKLIKLLLIAVGIANIATIAQLGGIIHLGREVIGDEDIGEQRRIFGVFGHANETGTLIACLIPAYIAVADSETGVRRWAWIGAMMSSVTVLILTASRGALVGLFFGGLWAALLCRPYLSVERAMKWVSTAVAVLIPMLIVVGIKYWDLLLARFLTEGARGGVREMSSGRTEIWARGIERMMERPWSFITGYGWNTWSVMRFDYISHNEYLSFEFELGLVGVISFILILRKTVVTALSAAAVADPRARSYMVACVFSALILSVALIFETLFIPWLFIWPYFGLLMRYACIALAGSKRGSSVPQSELAMRAGVAAKRGSRAGRIAGKRR